MARRPRLRLRLMSEYCCRFPVWGEGAELVADAVAVSEGLREELLAWQDLFEEHFHHEHGWSSPEAEADYARRGRGLHRRLQRELDERVELDLWPVTEPGPGAAGRR